MSVGEPGTAWRPSSRAQWIWVIVTVAWCGLLALGLPRIAVATQPQDQVIEAGGTVTFAGITVAPPAGWVRDAGTDILLKLNKGETSVLFFPITQSSDTAVALVEQSLELYGDSAASAQIGEVQEFTTDSGLAGASAMVLERESVAGLYAFSDGSFTMQAQASTTHAAWDQIREELDEMMATVQISPEDAS